MDLSVFSPVCLPDVGEGFINHEGHVYGEQFSDMVVIPGMIYSLPGWGDTGVQETSTDKLQETEVPIVDPSNCGDGLDEDLIVCGGGLGTGPCKVSHQRHSLISRVYPRVTVVGH